jgi:hypothetical protein
MTDSMLERVARAIYPKFAWAYKWDGNTPYEGLNEHAKKVLLETARAVLETMKVPTLAMREACTFEFAEVDWPAMIDAAIAGHPAESKPKPKTYQEFLAAAEQIRDDCIGRINAVNKEADARIRQLSEELDMVMPPRAESSQ